MKVLALVVSMFHLSGPVTLDGELREPAWRTPVAVAILHGSGPPAFAQIAYDEEALYVAFRVLDDRPREARIAPRIHDALRDEHDWVGVFIDTSNRRQTAAAFRIGPRGALTESIVDDVTGTEDFSVSIPFDGVASVHEREWTAELRIPLRSLPYPAEPVETWGILFSRNYPRAPREKTPCLVCEASTLIGDIDVGNVARSLPIGSEDSFERAAFVVVDGDFSVRIQEWPFRREFRQARWIGGLPANAIAIVHTHPHSRAAPSAEDRRLARRLRLPVYAVTRTTICAALPNKAVSCTALRTAFANR